VNDVALFVALGAAWLVAIFLVRRRVIRDVVGRRMSIGTAAVILGLVFGVVPLPALLWRPDAAVLIVFLSALLFVSAAGTTMLIARMLGLR
jgi:hypothetical protein